MLQSSATFWHLRVACTAFCAQHERGKHSVYKRTLKLRRWHNVECVHELIGIANSSDKIQCFNVAVHARDPLGTAMRRDGGPVTSSHGSRS